jgi:hypothetical protein
MKTDLPWGEVVWWNLASTPVKISVAQAQALPYTPATAAPARRIAIATSSGSTSRPVQPLVGPHRRCPVAAPKSWL